MVSRWIAVRPITYILLIDEAIPSEINPIAEDDFTLKFGSSCCVVVFAQPNSRTYDLDASGGQVASLQLISGQPVKQISGHLIPVRLIPAYKIIPAYNSY